MPDPYVYTDPDTDRLSINRSNAPGAVQMFATDTSDGEQVSITILGNDLDAVVAAMYEAAGRPTPIIEAAPPMNDLGPKRFADDSSIAWDPETGMVNMRGRHGFACLQFYPAEAVDKGAWLIAFGRAAADEPDRAEMERLTAFFDATMNASPEHLARLFLRRFKAEERAS
jgi:hypothetical protein